MTKPPESPLSKVGLYTRLTRGGASRARHGTAEIDVLNLLSYFFLCLLTRSRAHARTITSAPAKASSVSHTSRPPVVRSGADLRLLSVYRGYDGEDLTPTSAPSAMGGGVKAGAQRRLREKCVYGLTSVANAFGSLSSCTCLLEERGAIAFVVFAIVFARAFEVVSPPSSHDFCVCLCHCVTHTGRALRALVRGVSRPCRASIHPSRHHTQSPAVVDRKIPYNREVVKSKSDK